MLFFLPSYISTRVYEKNSEIRSVIVNENDKEFIVLEDNAALLWKSIVKNENEFSAEIIAQDIKKPIIEIKNFLDELLDINLISKISEKSFKKKQNNFYLKNSSGGRYSSGGYNEPAPGGSDLEAEYEMMDWAIDNGFLYSTSWELTYRCNERCVHCFNPGASHVEGDKTFRKVEEIDTKKIIKTLDDLKKIGVFKLMLTGGEILLRKDLFEILEHVRKQRFSFTIFTNGTLINEDQIQKLKNYYPYRVELSVYSHIPEKHDNITRLKNSWNKTMNTALKLKKNGIEVLIKMIVMKDTISDIAEFQELCKKNDLTAQLDFSMSAGVDGNSYPIKNLLPEPIDLIMESFEIELPLNVGTLEKPNSFDAKKSVGQYVCGAGRSGMNISAEGNISPCNSLPLEYGNLKNISMSDVWNNSYVGKQTPVDTRIYSKAKSESTNPSERLSSWQSVRRGMYDVCGTFDRCNWCQKCPGLAYLETGSELKPSTTNCRNAAARMIAYDLLKEHKDSDTVKKNIDIDKLKLKYNEETALWDPIKNIENNKEADHKNILLRRTKPSALEQLLKQEGFLS